MVVEKLFTKKECNNIMKQKYNLLDENCRKFYEREGLFMKKTKEVILNKEIERLNFKERLLVKIFRNTFNKVYRLGIERCFNYYNK